MTTTLNASNSGSGGLVATADASGVLALQTAGTTAVTIDTSQNVGIGTASPSQKLTLASGFVQTGNGIGGSGGVWFPYGGDAGTRTWRARTDIASYGDWGIEQSTTQTGTTFDTKFLIDPSGNLFVGGTTQNTATKPVYSSTTAKAWVSCSVSGSTVTVGASFNVSSVTRSGTGGYTVNFTNSFVDTNYAIAGIASGPSGGNAQVSGTNGGGVAVGSYQLYTLNMSNITPIDPNNFYVVFFR